MHSGQNKSRHGDEEEGDFSARAAYDGMAGFYDAFTAHHDYELWLGNLLPAIEAHARVRQKTLLARILQQAARSESASRAVA